MSLPQKRPLEDFFKPYGRTNAAIPRKRPSPSSTDKDEEPRRKVLPRTPSKTVTFKDVAKWSPLSHSSLPIRSPQAHKSPTPVKTKQTKLFEACNTAPENSVKPNVSFTFSDISERSQKVIEDGKLVAVKDSDDDTDSLLSLDDIFVKKKDAENASDSSPPEDLEAERTRALSLFTLGRSVPIVGKDKLRALYAKERATKFDLGPILDDHFGDEEAQQNISRMREDVGQQNDLDQEESFDRNFLTAVAQDATADQDAVGKLLSAVERTEALSMEKTFVFMRPSKILRRRSKDREPFPKTAIPDQMWASKDVKTQDRAYTSGYMAELGAAGALRDDALAWTFNEVTRESDLGLRTAYVQCIKASSKRWTHLHLTAIKIHSLFEDLGADPHGLHDLGAIEPKFQPVLEEPQPDVTILLSVLDMLHEACLEVDFQALTKLCSITLRLMLDRLVTSSNRLGVAVERLLVKLMSHPNEEARSHVHNRLLSDASAHLHDPNLQVQLLNHILPTLPETTTLKKSMADVFLLGESHQSGATIEQLRKFMSEAPAFSITRHVNSPAVDYSILKAKAQILDVAISSGNPFPESTKSDTSPTKKTLSVLTPQEVLFNRSIDALADQLHELFVSIKDTGASHMRRTEAKDTLQALQFRLLYSVRTRPRKKKHVFDSNGDMKAGSSKARWMSGEEYRDKERGGEFMKKFLAKQESNTS